MLSGLNHIKKYPLLSRIELLPVPDLERDIQRHMEEAEAEAQAEAGDNVPA
jgi:hypothetical protein